jgi:hypothetical protein
MRKGIINKYLNDPRLDSPMLRKALIWSLLRPKNDMSKVSYHKTSRGEHVNDVYLYDNPLSKPMWSLLMDISNRESFIKANNISADEAMNLIKEITGRQTLALLGVKNYHLEVALDYDYGAFNSKKNQNLYIELNRKNIEKITDIDEAGDRALTIINDFIHGERLLTPAEIAVLNDKVDKNGIGIFMTDSNTPGHFPARPTRNFGKPEDVSPVSFIKDLNNKRRKQRKKECPVVN